MSALLATLPAADGVPRRGALIKSGADAAAAKAALALVAIALGEEEEEEEVRMQSSCSSSKRHAPSCDRNTCSSTCSPAAAAAAAAATEEEAAAAVDAAATLIPLRFCCFSTRNWRERALLAATIHARHAA